MYKLRRKLFSQNFLRDRQLVDKLLGGSSIGKSDLALEIGPGKGIITEQLVKAAQHVIGVELDNGLYRHLQTKFNDCDNLTLYLGDVLDFSLPKLPYKVFANIPFAIEGKVIRKLIDSSNPPEDCYLVMMDKVAYRLTAKDSENQFSIIHKPWFNFEIYYRFMSSDFTPQPSVGVVMLRFQKRNDPLLPFNQRGAYEKFIKVGFGQGMAVSSNLEKRFGKLRVLDVLSKSGISRKVKPGQLSLEQWVRIYKDLVWFR